MTTQPDKLVVTQEDREAAAGIARIFLGNDDDLADELRSGKLARHWLLTELARHRIQSAEAAAVEATRLREALRQIAWLRPMGDCKNKLVMKIERIALEALHEVR